MNKALGACLVLTYNFNVCSVLLLGSKGPFLVMDTLFYTGITWSVITDVLGPGRSKCSYYYPPLPSILNKAVINEHSEMENLLHGLYLMQVKGQVIVTFKYIKNKKDVKKRQFTSCFKEFGLLVVS